MRRGTKISLALYQSAILVMALRGQGAHGVLIALALLPLAFGLALPAFRSGIVNFVRKQVGRLAEFGRSHSGPVPWRASALLVGLPFLIITLVNGRSISSFDNYPTILIAESLLTQGDTELSEHIITSHEAPRYYLSQNAKGVYSNYPIGMALSYLPVLALARIVGADIHDAKVQWRLAKLLAAFMGSLILSGLFLILLKLSSLRAAAWTTGFLGIGSGLLSTVGQGLFNHDGVLLVMVLLLAGEILIEKPSLGKATIYGLLLAWAASVRLTAVLILGPLVIWLAFRLRWKMLPVLSVAACGVATLTLYHWHHYGHLLGPQFLVAKNLTATTTNHFATAFWGSLISPSRGFFIYQPWALLFFLGLTRASFALLPQGLGLALLAGMILHFATITQWPIWWGGHCWGSRLMTEWLIPVSLLVALVIDNRSIGKKTLVTLALLAGLMQLPYVLGKARFWMDDPIHSEQFVPMEERLWSWRDFPPLYSFNPFR